MAPIVIDPFGHWLTERTKTVEYPKLILSRSPIVRLARVFLGCYKNKPTHHRHFAMNRTPTAAKISSGRIVDIYDQCGNYMHRVNVSPRQAIAAVVTPDTLTVSLVDGHVQVFALSRNTSPVLRYTR